MDRLEKVIKIIEKTNEACDEYYCTECPYCDTYECEAIQSLHFLKVFAEKTSKESSITLKNIDLSKTSSKEQLDKYYEELNEFREALIDLHNINAKGNVKQHVIEEYFDVLQTGLGLLQKEGITAEEVMAGYEKHLKKMEEMGNKPRD